MKLKLLLVFLFLISMEAFAQDQKWSVEANYGVVPNDGLGGDDNIIDIGLKYRFADLKFMQLGIGLNAGFAKENFNDYDINLDGKTKDYYFQPRVFADFIIPGIEKLRPSIGLGYSIINSDTDVISIGEPINTNTTNGGFNFNLGLSYDITKRFFIQAQYDFINLKFKNDFNFQGEVIKPDITEKFNNIKLGVGFRF